MRDYPVLEREMEKRGLREGDLARRLGLSPAQLRGKLRGSLELTWPESCLLQRVFFPDMDKDTLFRRGEE